MKKQWTKIAIVGMSCIFPGAGSTGIFSGNLKNKKSAIIPVPRSRWTIEPDRAVDKTGMPDRAVSDRAGLLTGFSFDPAGFALPPSLLTGLDPVLQLSLAAGRDLIDTLSVQDELRKRTGIILAAISLPTDQCSRFAWDLLCRGKQTRPTAAETLGMGIVSLPAALTARALGLKGGCFTLDAACASSLVAVKLACDHLVAKKADMMIAGGVSRPDSLYTQIGFTQLSALSPSGRCAPFDRTADGLVVGEGAGMVALKRLEDAIDAHDTIFGVITGAGVSNDLEGSLVTPASEGQKRAMQQAYGHAGWTIDDLQYMECHGSGTPVGDRVELSSIQAMIEQAGAKKEGKAGLCIGSVKSMIGHLLTAAGAAGLIKTLLALNQRFLPPSLNFSSPLPGSILSGPLVHVQTEPEDWKVPSSDTTRKAGISAFGFGGINAHILVEEFEKDARIHALSFPGEPAPASCDCAIVGMGVISPPAEELDIFKDLVFKSIKGQTALPGKRFRTAGIHDGFEKLGFYFKKIVTFPGEFHIPPNQLDDILPQHIILLKAVNQALADAGIAARPLENELPRTRFGAAAGIEFDFGATDFHLRWKAECLDKTLIDDIAPPLTFNRTLGALGGMAASRLAREFKIAGPCFTLSAGSVSGIKAIETGILSLQAFETDVFISCAVDMACDVRQFVLNDTIHPFDTAPNRIPASEGAGALVLKRLDQAIEDGDRIYAVVKGTGGRSGGELAQEVSCDTRILEQRCHESLESAINEACTTLHDIGLFETGPVFWDNSEHNFLTKALKDSPSPAFTMAASAVGDARTASGIFSIISASLHLYHDRLQGSGKQAAVSSLSTDGACCHAILEQYHTKAAHILQVADKISIPGKKPQKTPGEPVLLKPCRAPIPEAVFNRLNPGSFSGFSKSPSLTGKQKPGITPRTIAATAKATADAHEAFLEFTHNNLKALEAQFNALTRLQQPGGTPERYARKEPVLFDRAQCLEFATGRAGSVLGPGFDIIDTYPVRVRLPDEPLMLVDRILDIQGEKCGMTSGKIVTQHDVLEGAWYLDGGRAPVSICIEAGQADLFLCSWLGIDHVVKGNRRYRLLDAKVTFHRPLPVPGETIEYHIEIDRFLKQGDIYLFFFHYKGYIDQTLFISMRDGCAGFFTPEETMSSGGIILKAQDRAKVTDQKRARFLVPVEKESYTQEQVEALRKKDMGSAFGKLFMNRRVSESIALPSDKMHLIDRVLELDPGGGRYGLGFISAEADITPDKWFLTCHFIDDKVMPGTLMYECCAHALRIFTQRIGWISEDSRVYYDVILNNESDLKCRGPVTPDTRKARYDIEIKQIGYNPEPYVIADAHMFADDLQIVHYRDMGLTLRGITQKKLELFWSQP